MARYTGPKSKIARRFREPIFGPDKALERKNYPPGMHGASKRRGKQSEYAVQLMEKQKVKYTYGVLERQFENLFHTASAKEGITGENLLKFLEARLDNAVYRLGIAPTRSGARQLVGHKHITVNGSVVNIASYQLRAGDVIAVREKSKTLEAITNSVTETSPALVPLTITGKDQPWYEQLSGNSVFCRVWNDRASFEENILFTHWGLSGPAILQISSYWKPGESIYIDLLPDKDIIEMISIERVQNGKKMLLAYLSGLFTRKFADALSDYVPADKNLASLTKAELEDISILIHQFKVKPAGTKGYDKAEVMTGGVDTNELSSKTLESKKVPGLFFGGECVDVTGWLGGYNFQWAWASGFVIAQNL